MLYQVLHEIEKADGSITLNDLSIKLGVDRNALEGMLQFWVQKGRIQDDSTTCDDVVCSCGPSFISSVDCTFIAKMPKTYSVRTQNEQKEKGN
ncbi:MAG: hypothetical protein ISR58_04395 [Anaerolineales bacterium]|nr:hypothetical protein [Chloroflexota bacterium]MBL6980413.1 hypothetical protein [Anaerolineales bacterium]